MIHTEYSGFIDIHSHFLPGIDDGPDDYSQSMQTARQYIEAGVHCIIATPHYMPGTRWSASPDRIGRMCSDAESKLREADIQLRLLPGMEITFTDIIRGDFSFSRLQSLGDSNFYLVEFPFQNLLKKHIEKEIHTFLSGQEKNRFILAHPERCSMFIDNVEKVQSLVDHGMTTQINIGSILGRYGQKIQAFALELLNAGLVHFLATDSHAGSNRTPPTPVEMERLEKILGKEAIRHGFKVNPLNMLREEKLQAIKVDETLHIDEYCYQSSGNFINGLRNLLRNK